jgi:hypothetical protein
MSTSFRPNRITVRIAAGFGAVVVALSLAAAQLSLADHYAGQSEPAALAASANTRLAAAQVQDERAVR